MTRRRFLESTVAFSNPTVGTRRSQPKPQAQHYQPVTALFTRPEGRELVQVA